MVNTTKQSFAAILAVVSLAIPARASGAAAQKADEAEEALWRSFVSPQGLLYDYVGELPTPQDCADGRPNALGWWTPIENGPMFTGQYLAGLCRKALRTGSERDAGRCRRLAEGLLLCAEVAETPGMVCRGVGADGRCHYPLGSSDQTLPWFEGLSEFLRSGIGPAALDARIAEKMAEVGAALEASDWRIPADGAFAGQFRNNLRLDSNPFRGATAFLFVLRSLYDVTGDGRYLALYRAARDEPYPGHTLSRLDVCAAGYRADTALAGFEMEPNLLWIYTPGVLALRLLAEREEEPSAAVRYREGLEKCADAALPFVAAYSEYPNTAERPFRYANWREGWRWEPQKTQKDAARVAKNGYWSILGGRKGLERRTMTAPLSAAAICALGGRHRSAVDEAIRHYDYDTICLSEFFLAPFAFEFSAAPGCAAQGAEEPQEVQNPAPVLAPLGALRWRLPPKYATLEGDRLVIDIPAEAYPADAVAEADLPAALFTGARGFTMSVSASGDGLAKPVESWLGLKAQLHWRESASGREGFPNCAAELGDFGPKTLLNEAGFGGAAPDTVTLMLGLQGTSGRVEFDLSTLRSAPSQGLWRRINQDWRVRYPTTAAGGSGGGQPPVVRNQPRRGCMLPSRDKTEDDIATLASWGATMARFQIMRNWNGRDDNQDLAEYAAWIDSRLDDLENVLRWADGRGMKIVIDLHTPPGGKRAKDGQMNMFENDLFADAFIDTWRRIAARFCGHPAIYGYDLVNEPHQRGRVRHDYWTLQRRAAEAIREIDSVTPIIVESDNSDGPDAFAWLSPLRMDNVIYEVHCYSPMAFTHQGVGGRAFSTPERPLVWPGRSPDGREVWDREYIRRRLAPVVEFQKRHRCRIYVGEFSAAAWAPGAENYLRDCIALFEEYGWDWTYHAFRASPVWDVEKTGPNIREMASAAETTPRMRVLLDGFAL